MPTKARDPMERFMARVVLNGECEDWTGAVDKDGYPMFQLGVRKTVRGHRWLWEQRHGPIPPGVVVRHTCDRPPCVKDEHLIAGRPVDNVRDRDERGRTARGARVGNAKLSWDQVAEMRRRNAEGETAYRLAREFGVSYSTAKCIVSGHSWKTGDLFHKPTGVAPAVQQSTANVGVG
jgi:hypothetical protein